MDARTLVRTIIRQRVRARLGLLTEAASYSFSSSSGLVSVDVTLGDDPSGSGDEMIIGLSPNAPAGMTQLKIYYVSNNVKGENLIEPYAATAESDLSLKPGLKWSYRMPLRASSTVVVSYRLADGSGQGDAVRVNLGDRGTPSTALPQGSATTPSPTGGTESASVEYTGSHGLYKMFSDRIELTPRKDGRLIVDSQEEGGPEAAVVDVEAGSPVTIVSNYEKGNFLVYRVPYTPGNPIDQVGSEFSSYSNDGTATLPITPLPMPAFLAASAAAPAGEAAPSPEAPAPAADTPTAGAEKDAATPDPQAAASSMSVQDKIRTGGKAVQRDFADVEKEGVITLQDVKGQNQLSGHTWVENTPESRGEKLRDWSSGEGYDDKYTYYALISDKTGLPVAFVVASDPEDNDHYSTGRYIGPNSRQMNLRKAFCVLYHRATGEVHESCSDGPTKGSEDDVPGRGRGGKGKGGEASGSASKGAASGEGPGAVRLVSKDGVATRGRGDAMTGVLGISLRPAEKLRAAGYKIITKAKSKQGFSSFPKGPDDIFRRDPLFTAGGDIPPSSLAVRFEKPMAIVVDDKGQNPYVNFGENKSKDDIQFIKLGWGGRRLRLIKLEAGDKGFDEAAKWVFDHQEEFDLRPDGSSVKEPVETGGQGVRPAENRGEMMEEGRRLSLLNRYRF